MSTTVRSLGYPVNSTSGAAGGYQLGAGATLPPLLLDDDEAVAVAVWLRTVKPAAPQTGMEEASVRALSKLEQVLPVRLRKRVTALHAFILPLPNQGPTVDAGMLSAIAGACRDCATLRFGYHSRDGAASVREVEPHRLVHTGRRWYLAAWDIDRNNWRTFRIDRIELQYSSLGHGSLPRQTSRRRFCSLRIDEASPTRRIHTRRGFDCRLRWKWPPNGSRPRRGRSKPSMSNIVPAAHGRMFAGHAVCSP